MTPDDLARADQIRARADAATDGSWSIVGEYHGGHMIGAVIRPEKWRDVAYIGADEDVAYCAATIRDAEFIAAARSDVPWLLDRLAAETAEVERLTNPRPRKPRSAPKREDVIAYYLLAVGEGDGHEAALESAIDYALDYADDYEVPRWDEDPVVIRFGWLEGRCGRCGEELPADARLAAETERADKAEAAVGAAFDAFATNEQAVLKVAYAQQIIIDAGLATEATG